MRILAALAVALAATPALAQGAGPPSGDYGDGLLIATDPATHQVTGYFDQERGEQPNFSCIFYMAGPLAGGKASVRTWFPEAPREDVIAGAIRVTSPRTVQITLDHDHGGCGMVQSFADREAPAEFELATAHAWTQIRVARTAKTHFWDSPTAAAPRKSYIVKGEGVGVRAVSGAFLQVDYVGGEHTVTGWVKASDLYPAP